ncbi:S1C family serine protease [Cohnella pontilimi]|uniref:S1C family serine protease n=1 Tax=Cohnella pontilimi TaxID=2564100 RepID=UPI00145F17F6|nr:trypsin-like peptidase domain-containing protein [Cohnella pontilimi]
MEPRQKLRRTRISQAARHDHFVRIYRSARKGVVFIRTVKNNEENEYEPPFSYFFPRESEPNDTVLGIGTGFVIDKNGLIVTSEHVVRDSRTITVKLYNGKPHRAKVVWSDEDHDVAILKIETASSLHPLRLGSSKKSEIGEIVVAIGNPLGLESSITSGIISGKHDSVALSDIELTDIIQTDCAINPGSSGGPLLNLKGEVIGMNAFIAKNKNGLSFALGIDGIKKRIRRFLPG